MPCWIGPKSSYATNKHVLPIFGLPISSTNYKFCFFSLSFSISCFASFVFLLCRFPCSYRTSCWTIGYAPVNTDYFYYPLQPKLLPHISSMFVLLFCAAFLHLSYSLVCVCVQFSSMSVYLYVQLLVFSLHVPILVSLFTLQ